MTRNRIAYLGIGAAVGCTLLGSRPTVAVIDDTDDMALLVGDRSKPVGGLIQTPKPPLDDGEMTRQRRRAAERKARKAGRS